MKATFHVNRKTQNVKNVSILRSRYLYFMEGLETQTLDIRTSIKFEIRFDNGRI